MELGQRQSGLTRYTYVPGLPFMPDMSGGRTFPQVLCAPIGSPLGSSRPLFTDDVIYGIGKTLRKEMFQLVVLLDTMAEAKTVMQDLNDLAEAYQQIISVQEATYLVINPIRENMDAKGDIEGVWRLVTVQEYDTSLWNDLPDPSGYDAGRLRQDVKGKYVILRPDRFIFAACRSLRELTVAVGELDKLLKA